MKNVIKTVALMFLIGLSLYQIRRLWFDDLSDFNLFYNAQDTEIVDKENYFIKPNILAIYNLNGDEKYSWIKQNKKEFDDIFFKSVNLMKSTLTKGRLVEEVPVEELWQKRNILFKYDYTIDPNLLLQDLNIKNLSFAEKVQPFNEIIIAPGDETRTNIYFINDNNYNDIKAYSLSFGEDKPTIETLDKELKEGLQDKIFPYYESSKELNIDLFAGNVLIPDNQSLEANTVFLSKPFFKDGILDLSELSTFINGFSRYKLSIYDENDEKLTYMDIDNSVHLEYYQSGFVAYTREENRNKKNISPIEAFYTAEGFIKNTDKQFTSAVYGYSLANYYIEDKRVTFYYKYKFNGIDMDIPTKTLQPLDIQYPVEITIEDGQVTKYKRYLLQFENIDPQEEYTFAYNDVLDNMREDYPNEIINDISLRYLLDSNTQTLQLNWVVVTENNIVYNEPIN